VVRAAPLGAAAGSGTLGVGEGSVQRAQSARR